MENSPSVGEAVGIGVLYDFVDRAGSVVERGTIGRELDEGRI